MQFMELIFYINILHYTAAVMWGKHGRLLGTEIRDERGLINLLSVEEILLPPVILNH